MSADEAAVAAEIAATKAAEKVITDKAAQEAADKDIPDQNNPLEMSDEAFLEMSATGFENIPETSDDDPDKNKDIDPDPDKNNDPDKDNDDLDKDKNKSDPDKDSDDPDKDKDNNLADIEIDLANAGKAKVDKDDDPDKVDGDDDDDPNPDKDSGDNPNKEDGDDPGDKNDKDNDKSDDEKEAERIVNASLQLEELFVPFKANGREMKVDTVEEARILMQFGANYNKKMAALKPNLKILKMLENNDLLDEGKLSFLIDLDKKDPGAIAKLLKDSKIDTEELDIATEKDYKPNTYTVNDKEVELDETLNDIRDTDSYAKTLNIISTKWDEASKAALLENPAGIRILNEHVALGYYEKITSAVETERMFGRIPQGMSDLEAYKFVGEAINAKGGFKPQGKSESKTVIGQAVKKVDPKVNEKKRAARSTKGKSVTKTKAFNPLAMSDEDFEKTGLEKFI